MMRPIRRLARNRDGATAVEFALVLPLLAFAIMACVQLGTLFFANAGLQNAIGESARLATLWPRRDLTQLQAEIQASQFGLTQGNLATPQVVPGTIAGQDFVDITLVYTVDLNFLFFTIPGVTLQETRRAYRP